MVTVCPEWNREIDISARQASKETNAIINKVESNNEGYKKERNNWVKIVLWIEEIQGFGLKIFQVKIPYWPWW